MPKECLRATSNSSCIFCHVAERHLPRTSRVIPGVHKRRTVSIQPFSLCPSGVLLNPFCSFVLVVTVTTNTVLQPAVLVY